MTLMLKRVCVQVRGYGLALILKGREGASDILDVNDLHAQLKKRKRINLLHGCEIEPWNPRPVCGPGWPGHNNGKGVLGVILIECRSVSCGCAVHARLVRNAMKYFDVLHAS
eukprot:8844113-Pyramimonas_sp.AAC.2